MTRFLQALLTGVFFTFIYDFFIFLGVFQNYIKKYEIDLYYNILFADHQSFIVFALFTLILGAVIIYLDNIKVSIIIISTLFFLSLISLVPPIGEGIAKAMLMQENTTLHVGKYTYTGDIYYNGRDNIYLFDKELNKMLKFNKDNIKDEAYK